MADLSELKKRIIANAMGAADPDGIPNAQDAQMWLRALQQVIECQNMPQPD